VPRGGDAAAGGGRRRTSPGVGVCGDDGGMCRHPAAFIYLTPCSMNASGDCVKNARSAQAPASSVSGGGRAFAAVAGGLVAHEDVGRKTPKKARV
jgi:hypothetical protein